MRLRTASMILVLILSVDGIANAQKLFVNAPFQRMRDTALAHGYTIDSAIEGRIQPRVTSYTVTPWQRFGVQGEATFFVDGLGTVTSWAWSISNTSEEDFNMMAEENSKLLGAGRTLPSNGTGEVTEFWTIPAAKFDVTLTRKPDRSILMFGSLSK